MLAVVESDCSERTPFIGVCARSRHSLLLVSLQLHLHMSGTHVHGPQVELCMPSTLEGQRTAADRSCPRAWAPAGSASVGGCVRANLVSLQLHLHMSGTHVRGPQVELCMPSTLEGQRTAADRSCPPAWAPAVSASVGGCVWQLCQRPHAAESCAHAASRSELPVVPPVDSVHLRQI